ncbi:MAG: zinc-binding alcohol dehydrogenase [Chloroflexi bacterium]|nr:zinc-binding alcohol dehydrogenase [Chloroflexota bacterium]
MTAARNGLALYFVGPGQVALRDEPVPEPGANQVLVKTILSAISTGTELLIYRGLAPAGLAADETITALRGSLGYPLKYGYSTVGSVTATGQAVDASWAGKLVFAFHPHQSHFIAEVSNLLPVPDGIAPEDAVFLANMETAVNFALDGMPVIGEQVVVFGQGVVGLLTTALLAQLPLARLITLDRYPLRRRASLELGAHASLDPAAADAIPEVRSMLQGSGTNGGADMTYELSGSPAALDQAVAVTGFDGRVVIGSWYGRKRVDLDLGGAFHRSRIRLISSQVSTIAPQLTGRWSKARRFELAWRMLQKVLPSRYITHSFPLGEAARAYRLLDESPGEAIQVVLTS